MKLKFKVCNHADKVMDKVFPYDGYIRAENNECIYIFTRIPNYRGKHCKVIANIYDKAMGTWYEDYVPEKVANKVLGFKASNKLQSPIYVKNTNNNIVGMMKHARKKKKSSGGRCYEYPYQQTQDLCHRGYTDESHWKGIMGSRLGHYQRYV